MRKRRASSSARQRSSIPLFLVGIGVLILLGVVIWQLTRLAPEPPATTNNQSDIPNPEISRVSLADAKTAFDQQAAIFLDVRDPASFDTGHIPGAVNIPLAQLENRASELDPNSQIITYCT